MTSLALLLALLAPLPPSQDMPFEEARITMRAEGVEDGLPNPRVHCTFRDHRGRLWVGTQEGAAFMGGNGWTPFPLPKEAPSIYIRAMAETADGALWFGTEAGGLWRHHRGEWRHWNQGTGLPASRINVLLANGNELWVGTGGAGLLLGKNGTFSQVEGPAELWVWAIAALPDAKGQIRIWVGGEKQVWFSEGPGWRRLGLQDGFWDAGANGIVGRRGPDGRLEVWMSAWKMGLGRWDPERQRFEGPIPGSPSRSPTSLASLKGTNGEDDIWMGTYDAGLTRYSSRGWEVFGPQEGFPSTGVYCILVNPARRPAMWVGTRGAGLVSVDPSGWRALPPLANLPSSQANCFLETFDSSGGRTFWIGTDRGLVRWTAKGIHVDTTADGLPADFITDIQRFDGPAGPEIWASTLGGVVRSRGDRWESFGSWDTLGFYRVQSLAADRQPDGSLRIYAGGDGGLAVLEGGHWRMVDGGQALPPNIIVTSLLRVPEPGGGASLWVGMRGGGIARLSAGTWHTFGTRNGLLNPSVYGLAAAIAPSGQRWLFATMVGGGGLARLDMDHPELGFRTWDTDELPGFPTQGIQRAVVSERGALYLTTSRGVVRLDLRNPDWEPTRATTFSTVDGLPSAASEAGATYIDRAGRVWVGTARGIAVLDPSLEMTTPPPGPPIIDDVLVQGRRANPGAPIRMGYRDQRLRVSFGLPTSFRHQAVLYRTQLLGLEQEPQEWTPRAEREFTTLPPSQYTLRIWGRDGLGVESPPVDLTIIVAPPWWQTWWIISLIGLGVATFVAMVANRLRHTLVRRAQALEALVAQRTRDLEGANEALHHQSLTDPLTGLANRRSFQSQIGSLVTRLARRQSWTQSAADANRDMGFLLLDLDHFKVINDTWGHQTGDQVLQQTADLLRSTVRDGDLVIRWGGEEFLVVAPDCSVEELPALAERIRAQCAAHPFSTGGRSTISMTVSLGFAAMPLLTGRPEAFTWEHIVSLADQGLYRAKGAGRNCWAGLLPVDEAPGAAELPAPLWDAVVASGWVRSIEGPE